MESRPKRTEFPDQIFEPARAIIRTTRSVGKTISRDQSRCYGLTFFTRTSVRPLGQFWRLDGQAARQPA